MSQNDNSSSDSLLNSTIREVVDSKCRWTFNSDPTGTYLVAPYDTCEPVAKQLDKPADTVKPPHIDTGQPVSEKIPVGDQRAIAPKPATEEPPKKTVVEPSSDNGSRTGRTAPQNQTTEPLVLPIPFNSPEVAATQGALPNITQLNPLEEQNKKNLSGKLGDHLNSEETKHTAKEPYATQTEPRKETSPRGLTAELAKQIVDAVANDSNFDKDNIKGNYYEQIFTRFGGRFSGSIREFTFAFINTYSPFYDAQTPEVDKIVCTGITNDAIDAIKKHPEVLKQLTKLDTTQDRGFNTGVAHTAVLVVNGEREYVFDWYQSLEADNPRIHTYENWLQGNDDKGIYYDDIKNNTFAGQFFLKYQ